MEKKNKRKSKIIVSSVLALALIISIIISLLAPSSFALEFIGSGTGQTGGGSVGSSGGYSVYNTMS